MLQLNTNMSLGSRARGLLRKSYRNSRQCVKYIYHNFVAVDCQICIVWHVFNKAQILARHLPSLVCQWTALGASCVNGGEMVQL